MNKNIQLTDQEQLHLAAILDEFPGDPSAHQIDIATFLARDMAAWAMEADRLRDEGSVIETPTGRCKINPRVSVVSDLLKSILRARRSLQIHARGLHGEARRIGRRREILKENEASDLLSDDLLAKPRACK